MKQPLSQPVRLLILSIYVGLLFAVSFLSFGSALPPTTEKGLWFYSGLAAILLGNLIVTPFYSKPADAISYTVAALIAMLSVNVWVTPERTGFDRFLWTITTSYVGVVLLSAILSIALKDVRNDFVQKISQSLRSVSDALGTPKSVFSAVFLFAIIAFHRESSREYLPISAAWLLAISVQPLESVATLIGKWKIIWKSLLPTVFSGTVVGHQVPSVVLIRQEDESAISFGDPLIVRADSGRLGLALALDHVGFSEGPWCRALHLDLPDGVRSRLSAYAERNENSPFAIKVSEGVLDLRDIADSAWQKKDRLIGLVAPDTDISHLVIEIIRTDIDLTEGHLVEVRIGQAMVLYQIISGLTREEIVQQKNTRGFVKAKAKKIGRWNGTAFESVRWVPQPNAPIFLVRSTSASANAGAVGYFPGTDYPVSVDTHQLVTHNTAILGILGVGKSFLAIELAERMIKAGIKIICLDLTNQYAEQLSSYCDPDQGAEIQALQTIGKAGKNSCKQNVEEGGSAANFKIKLKEILSGFLAPANMNKLLKIFNPAEFEVWKQDSRLFSGTASMASLSPTEITRIFAETTLEILQTHGMTDKARCCLVLEEAHSLIPEWQAVAQDGDKAATNGTAKAILQGRKFGFGCLVITQRTANVTKSILNQCNTIFAMRVFDSTGMEFLKNYIGNDFAGVLSTLEDRHAIIFGRGSSCKDPVMIRLNDRDKFIAAFRPEASAQREA